MPHSEINSHELVEQIQIAHRVSVAFYRRILPTLDAIADKFECSFQEWKPIHTPFSCKSGTRPSSVREWNFVPLFASSHVYWHSEGELAQPTDLCIRFKLYVDENMDPVKRCSSKLPGAIDLPSGSAVLKVELYRPLTTSYKPFESLWQNPKGNFKIDTFEVLLEEVISNYQTVIEKIRQHIH